MQQDVATSRFGRFNAEIQIQNFAIILPSDMVVLGMGWWNGLTAWWHDTVHLARP